MNDRGKGTSASWFKIKAWVAGLASVIVILPSLINGGIDVYKSVWNVPKTDQERTNRELSMKYFNKSPLGKLPIHVDTALGTVEGQLSVWDEGDVYIEYGKVTQWFASPLRQAKLFSLTPSVYAQEQAAQGNAGDYRQTERLVGNRIVRDRYYADGTRETYVIDRNTGVVLKKTVARASKTPAGVKLLPGAVRQLPGVNIDARVQK